MKRFFKRTSTIQIAIILIIAVLLSFGIAGTFSKFTESKTISGSANLAEWNIHLKINETASGSVKTNVDLGTSALGNSNMEINELISSGRPSATSKGYLPIEFECVNTQVPVLLGIKVHFINLPTGMVFSDILGRSLNLIDDTSTFAPSDQAVNSDFTTGMDLYGHSSKTYYGNEAKYFELKYYLSLEEITQLSQANLSHPFFSLGFNWEWIDDGEQYDKGKIYVEIQVEATQLQSDSAIPTEATIINFVAPTQTDNDLVIDKDNVLNILTKEICTDTLNIEVKNNFYLDMNGFGNKNQTYNVTVADGYEASVNNIVMGTYRRKDVDYKSNELRPIAVVTAPNANVKISYDFKE